MNPAGGPGSSIHLVHPDRQNPSNSFEIGQDDVPQLNRERNSLNSFGTYGICFARCHPHTQTINVAISRAIINASTAIATPLSPTPSLLVLTLLCYCYCYHHFDYYDYYCYYYLVLLPPLTLTITIASTARSTTNTVVTAIIAVLDLVASSLLL